MPLSYEVLLFSAVEILGTRYRRMDRRDITYEKEVSKVSNEYSRYSILLPSGMQGNNILAD
jgi:hypothetical protein